MEFKNVLLLLGTIWPLVGTTLALIIAFAFHGGWRWLWLVSGPILMLLPCMIYAEQLAYNGNMLFVALMGIVFVFLLGYYPVLAVAGIISLIKSRQNPG